MVRPPRADPQPSENDRAQGNGSLDIPEVGPIGVDTIIEPSAEGIGEGQRIAFLSKLNPKGDARTARGMFENRRVYPVMIQPASHRDHRGGEIGADAANFHGVERRCPLVGKLLFRLIS